MPYSATSVGALTSAEVPAPLRLRLLEPQPHTEPSVRRASVNDVPTATWAQIASVVQPPAHTGSADFVLTAASPSSPCASVPQDMMLSSGWSRVTCVAPAETKAT